MTGVLIGRGARGTQGECTSGGSREGMLGLGIPSVAGELQKQDKMRKDPPLQISQEARPH